MTMRAAFSGTATDSGGPGARLIEISKIIPMPGQPRRHFADEALDTLAESVRTQGVLQPILIRPLPDGRFGLIAGERRLKAAQRAGLLRIPAIVRDITEEEALDFALFENTQREDLNAYEFAQATLNLIVRRMNWDVADAPTKLRSVERAPQQFPEEHRQLTALFQEIGRAGLTSFVKQSLRVLNLPDYLLSVLQHGTLDYTKVLLISGARPEHHQTLLEAAVDENLSVAELRRRRQALEQPAPPPARHQEVARLLTSAQPETMTPDQHQRFETLLAELQQLLRPPGKDKTRNPS